MKSILISFLLLSFLSFSLGQFKMEAEGGGTHCAACTIVVGMFERYSLYHEKSFEDTMDKICNLFPIEFAQICNYFVNTYGDIIIKLLNQDLNADQICHVIQFCTDPTCQLWGESKIPKVEIELTRITRTVLSQRLQNRPTESPWDWITNLINRLAQSHEPIVDIDSDNYSTIEKLRGTDWRGRDCDDFDDKIHPGRAVFEKEPYIDYDCNGISGTDSKGNSYEDIFCGSSGALGTILIGDSAGAHFSIPPSYFDPKLVNETTYSNLLSVLSDEFDWPFRSGYTGIQSGYNSIYQYMRERNKCNHRDYQNLGVNGARSSAVLGILGSMARNRTLDKPALIFFELVGNDVCNGHHTFDTMTTVEEFKKNILLSLNYLEETLPYGSHVVFVGLADGRILWDTLHNRSHPLGPTYSEVYDFLNCLQISPCWVWMNSNETVRNIGSERAAELSAVYSEIISNYSSVYKNFDMVYYDFPFKAIIPIWVKQGGQVWELIEASDGFHPSQIANGLMADWFWNRLIQDHPKIVGPTNPNNDLITQIFGNQGGY